LVGLEIDWPVLESLFATHDLPPLVAGRASREAVPVYNVNGRQIGQATSRTFSPILKKYIALATIESEFAYEGLNLSIEVTVEYTRQQCPARVASTPFYDPTHKRK
jgi:aminomethyltransferase